MNNFSKNLTQFCLIFFISFMYILLIELLLRTFIFFKTNEKNYFFYGFNKNLKMEIVDLSEFKFNLSNLDDHNIEYKKLSKTVTENSKQTIWTFGASLTHGFACGNNSSSWPDELKKINNNFDIINYGFPSIYSEDSIKKLINELNSKEVKKPDYILWAHRDEEKLAVVRGLKRNKNKINENFSFNNKSKNNYYIMRIEKTLQSNSILYLLFKHAFDKLQKRFSLYNQDRFNQNLFTENDYKIILKNFEINTLDAIENSYQKGIRKFILVSLFTDDEFVKDERSSYLNNYLNSVKKIQSKSKKDVFFVNTIDYLNQEEKINFENYYCENKHYTLGGNQKIAKIINDILSN